MKAIFFWGRNTVRENKSPRIKCTKVRLKTTSGQARASSFAKRAWWKVSFKMEKFTENASSITRTVLSMRVNFKMDKKRAKVF